MPFYCHLLPQYCKANPRPLFTTTDHSACRRFQPCPKAAPRVNHRSAAGKAAEVLLVRPPACVGSLPRRCKVSGLPSFPFLFHFHYVLCLSAAHPPSLRTAPSLTTRQARCWTLESLCSPILLFLPLPILQTKNNTRKTQHCRPLLTPYSSQHKPLFPPPHLPHAAPSSTPSTAVPSSFLMD